MGSLSGSEPLVFYGLYIESFLSQDSICTWMLHIWWTFPIHLYGVVNFVRIFFTHLRIEHILTFCWFCNRCMHLKTHVYNVTRIRIGLVWQFMIFVHIASMHHITCRIKLMLIQQCSVGIKWLYHARKHAAACFLCTIISRGSYIHYVCNNFNHHNYTYMWLQPWLIMAWLA